MLYGSTDVVVSVIYRDGMNFYKNIEVKNEWSYTYTPIFGTICIAGYWRSRTNEEVRQLCGELDIVTEMWRGLVRKGR